MKHKISVSIEVATLKWVDTQIQTGRFRSRSHGLELCTRIVCDRKIV